MSLTQQPSIGGQQRIKKETDFMGFYPFLSPSVVVLWAREGSIGQNDSAAVKELMRLSNAPACFGTTETLNFCEPTEGRLFFSGFRLISGSVLQKTECQSQGEWAQRIPILLVDMVGSYPMRKAVRTPFSPEDNPPPRTVRLVLGIWLAGFSSSELAW